VFGASAAASKTYQPLCEKFNDTYYTPTHISRTYAAPIH